MDSMANIVSYFSGIPKTRCVMHPEIELEDMLSWFIEQNKKMEINCQYLDLAVCGLVELER